MKTFDFLKLPAIKACMFLIVLSVLSLTEIKAQNCSDFKVSLVSRSYIAGKTIFIWSIKNLNPGNGTNGTTKDLKYWGLTLNSCVKSKNIVMGGYSPSKASWKNFIATYKADSDNCIATPAIKFNYGTRGKFTSYYILILKGNYQTGTSDAYFKYGNNCCTQSIQGVGCDCSSVGLPTVENNARCGPGAVTLKASGCTNGTLQWYKTASGGTSIASGSSYSPNLTQTTTYYVSCKSGGCVSPRVSVTGTVNPLPADPVVRGGTRCGSGNVTLSATGCTDGTLNWYSTANGSAPIASGSVYQPYLFYNSFPLYNTNRQSYFVSCTVDGCESARSEVVASAQFSGMVPATADGVSRCGPGSVTINASCPNGALPGWHLQLGTPPIGSGNSYTTSIDNTTTFYVSCPSCALALGRVPVTATVNNCEPASATLYNRQSNKTSETKPDLSISASPNPYVDKIKFMIQSPVTAKATLDIYNMTGQKIKTIYQGQLDEGEEKFIEYDVPEKLKSTIFYRLTVGKEVRTGIMINTR